MDSVGGMSGGGVFDSEGYLVGIVSSSFDGGPTYITLVWDAFSLQVEGSIPSLATGGKVTLLGAMARGLVKIKGRVARSLWGDVSIKLSSDERKLFAQSLTPEELRLNVTHGLNEDERLAFVEEWGIEMEAVACEAAIPALESLTLSQIVDLLKWTPIPPRWLDFAESFSVEDLDGVEDFEISSTEALDDVRMRVECSFDLLTTRWIIGVRSDPAVDLNETLRRLLDVEVEGAIVKMKVYQRCYFKCTMVFDRDQEAFVDVVILATAVKRPRA